MPAQHPATSRTPPHASQRPSSRAFGMALAVHVLLIIVLALGVTWNTQADGPVQVELWAAGSPLAANTPPPQTEVESESEPELQPDNPPDPPPPEQTPVPPAQQEAAPDIALEEARRRQAAEAEALRLERERLVAERAERDRLEAERREQERADAERREAERRAERERQIARNAERQNERERLGLALDPLADDKDDGLWAGERNVVEQAAREEDAKKRPDALLREASAILADAVDLLTADQTLAAEVLPKATNGTESWLR